MAMRFYKVLKCVYILKDTHVLEDFQNASPKLQIVSCLCLNVYHSSIWWSQIGDCGIYFFMNFKNWVHQISLYYKNKTK